MLNIKTLYSPEGESGQGGGVATATPPAAPDLSQMDRGDAIASVFKTDPRQTQRREPKKEIKPATPEKKPEAAPLEKKNEEPEKRTSIFQAPPEKKVESAPVDISETADDGLPENDWKAAKAVRKQLRTELSTRDDRISKAEKELAEYHALVPDRSEVTKLREEHKAFSDKVAILDYQSHPDFQQKFTEPKAKLANEVKIILTDNGIEGVDFASLVAKPRLEMAKAVSEITDKLNSFDAGEFRLALREYQKLSGAEQAAVLDHRDGLKKLNEQSQAKQRTSFEGKWKTTSLASFAQKLDPAKDAPPEEVESVTRINQGIDEIRNVAERYAFAVSNEDMAAEVAIKAANYDFVIRHAFPRMQSDYQNALELNKQLSQKLEELSAHRPGANFDGAAPSGKAETLEDMDIKSAVAKVYRSR